MWRQTSGWGLSLRRFFETEAADPSRVFDDNDIRDADSPLASPQAGPKAVADIPATARIAVYDDLSAAPRVEDIDGASASDFIERLAVRVYEIAGERGGAIPYTVVREVVENLIHARFAEVVVSVLDGGRTIRFSDHGPGIDDKERSFAPGFSTATGDMKAVIRGVGSGLPIVKEYLSFAGGYVTVEDNLGAGTVVTLRLETPAAPEEELPETADAPLPVLTTRHKRVLSLAMELGAVGPSAIARELGVALSTAYRDLAHLEALGLMASDRAGKRTLTETGVSSLDALFSE